MSRIVIIALFLVLGKISYSQTSESYAVLSEGDIKNEIALFSKASALLQGVDSANNIKLTEIKLKRCSTDFVLFESGDIIALDKLISIHSKMATPLITGQSATNEQYWGTTRNTPAKQISEVRYIHYKYQLILPESAIAGLYEPKFCVNPKRNNKLGRTTSSNCKVYQSIDKRRVYIYMLNGDGSEQYEVTWVIQDNKYLMRILDRV